MEVVKSLIFPTHTASYRSYRDYAEIIGVYFVTPDSTHKPLSQRMCYKVKYLSDGEIDHVPFSSVECKAYTIMPANSEFAKNWYASLSKKSEWKGAPDPNTLEVIESV